MSLTLKVMGNTLIQPGSQIRVANKTSLSSNLSKISTVRKNIWGRNFLKLLKIAHTFKRTYYQFLLSQSPAIVLERTLMKNADLIAPQILERMIVILLLCKKRHQQL